MEEVIWVSFTPVTKKKPAKSTPKIKNEIHLTFMMGLSPHIQLNPLHIVLLAMLLSQGSHHTLKEGEFTKRGYSSSGHSEHVRS